MKDELETYYGLPSKVIFCTKCVMSNQRPTSTAEFKHTINSKKQTMGFDEDGVCDACRAAEQKDAIDWDRREKDLLTLLEKYRKSDGTYDCLIPGSGGKDSAYQAHVLKYKYGMNPLTYTWPPIIYTDYGYENWKNWIEIGGFDNVTLKPNGKVMRLLTRLSIENIFHPFQTFFFGQKNLAPKIAAKFGIDLVFYGENEAEYGNPIADNNSSLRDKAIFAAENTDDIYLGGVSIKELQDKHELSRNDLGLFLPPTLEEINKTDISVRYLGYYLRWTPQEVYYYAVENCGFKARPHRSQGTFSKYSSIDDKIDDLHFYTTFLKFGIGRASYDASQEIRNHHITREEGSALVNRFDGEFPDRYFNDIIDYLGINNDHFENLCDKFRSPHLWGKDMDGNWKLNHNVNNTGLKD
ncbi:N-acetyl sugar amidotransferase [Akkermansiaceae bacterium]|nr:N-acetyl sugar amidotransferase [Akkermansiaceae bacterium]MDC0291156.1 N-acetyl sugar amidotransferase [Akkermansiaceae bacterium]